MKRILLLFLIIFLVACDHTDLSGQIILQDENYQVNDIIPLVLEVPDSLSEIYRVMWEIESETGMPLEDYILLEGESMVDLYTESQLLDLFQVDELNYDRMALFIPKTSDTFTIQVSGFYKQTNPQAITAITIDVE